MSTGRRPPLARDGPLRVAGVHAVVIRDGRLSWEERDDPVCGDTELLVAVRAAGLNGADLVQRVGAYPAPPGWPQDIPGMEMAGEVVAVGRQVTLFGPGDRVMAVVGGGAQATVARVDESHALAVPDALPWPEAGGFPEVFWTAYDALFTRGRARDGRAGVRQRRRGRRRHGGRADGRGGGGDGDGVGAERRAARRGQGARGVTRRRAGGRGRTRAL